MMGVGYLADSGARSQGSRASRFGLRAGRQLLQGAWMSPHRLPPGPLALPVRPPRLSLALGRARRHDRRHGVAAVSRRVAPRRPARVPVRQRRRSRHPGAVPRPEEAPAIVAGGPINAGDARAHWDLTVHGSGPNEGTYAREAWVARYIRVDTIYNGVSHSHFDRFDLNGAIASPSTTTSRWSAQPACGEVTR